VTLLAGASAIVEISLVLFAAPLVLGAFVVLQRASQQVAMLYFGFLSVAFVVVLVAAIIGLWALQR
jgi:hypothetical protein